MGTGTTHAKKYHLAILVFHRQPFLMRQLAEANHFLDEVSSLGFSMSNRRPPFS
jgi:hypothetical protein